MSRPVIDVVSSVIMGLCCLVGIPGNIAVMVISRKYQLDTFTLKLIMSLAMSDLLSLLFLPAQIYNLMFNWLLGNVACRLLFFMIYWSMHASVFTVTLLSIQRYLQVLHAHCWTRLQVSGQWALLVAVWAMAACIASPCLSARSLQDSHCNVSYHSDAEEAAILLCQTVFGFVLPFTTLVCFYFYLQKRVSKMVFLRTRRMTRLVTSIVMSFSVFWIPLHLFNLLALTALATKWEVLKDVCDSSWATLTALTFINACLNPFLYAFAQSQPQTVCQQHNIQLSTHIPTSNPLPR